MDILDELRDIVLNYNHDDNVIIINEGEVQRAAVYQDRIFMTEDFLDIIKEELGVEQYSIYDRLDSNYIISLFGWYIFTTNNPAFAALTYKYTWDIKKALYVGDNW